MRKYFKLLLLEPGKSIVLRNIRERLLKTMLFTSLLVGTLLYLIALIPAFQTGSSLSILIYTILFVAITLITFLPRLPYRFRTTCWLGLAYILGSLNLAVSGFNLGAGLFLITFIAMAILFLDLSGGLIALVLSCATVSIFGYINVTAHNQIFMGLPQSNPLFWIIGGIVFLLMGILLIYSLNMVVRGLEENLTKTSSLAENLEKTNKSLRMSEARYRTLVETSPNLVVLLDLNGNILMANQIGLGLFGYKSQDEVIGKNMSIFVFPDDQQHVVEAVQKTLQEDKPEDIDCRALKKNNETFFIEFNAALVRDETGGPQAIIATGKDISARKEVERLLQETKDKLAEKVAETTFQLKLTSNRLEELVKRGPIVIFSYRAADHAVTYMSENVTNLLGYEADEFLQNSNFWDTCIHPEDRIRLFTQIESLRNTERYGFDYRFLHKNGTYRWLREEIILLRDEQDNPLEYVGSWLDITELKRNQATLSFSEDKYRSLYEGMMDGYVIVDMDGRIQQYNWAYLSMLGYPSEELNQLTYQDLTPEKWHEIEQRIVQGQILPRGYSDNYEKEYIRKDGTIIPVELRTVLNRDEQGNPSGMWAIVRDISERKRIEQELRESEQRYRELLDSSMQGVIVFQDMRIVYVNQALLEAFGYSEAELKSLTAVGIVKLVHKEDRRAFFEMLQTSLRKTGTPKQATLRVFRKNGEICWAEAKTSSIVLHGKPAALATGIDVTEIRRAEAELRESEQRYRELLDNSLQGIIIFQNMRIIYANQTVLDALGYSEAEIKSLKQTEILRQIHPDDHQILVDSLQVSNEEVSNQIRHPIRVMGRGGGYIWLETRTTPISINGKPAVLLTGINTTEIRQAQVKLEESAKLRETIFNASDALVILVNIKGEIIITNEKFAQKMGKNVEDLIGVHFSNHLPTEDLTEMGIKFEQAIKSGKPVITLESMGENWFENGFYPITDVSGNVTSVAVFVNDITERRRITEALRASEERYRSLAETAHDMIFIINREDRIEYVNSFGAKFLGYEPQQLIGQPRRHFFPPSTSQHQEENIQGVLKSGQAISVENTNVFPTGTTWLNTWLVPLKDASGQVTSVLGVSRDISTRKKAELALQEARDQLEERVAERTSELTASQEKLRLLTAQTISAQEEERRAIARDLHDEAGQALITLKYDLTAIQGGLPKSKKETLERLSDSIKVIDQTMLHIRGLAHSLRPPVMDIGGINLSLQDFCEETSERTKLPIHYQGVEIPRLPDEIGISLYRFVQEAITNILKHAMASEVEVRLQSTKRKIMISVSDDGRGMEDTAESGGLGLLGIKERLSLLGGNLVIQTRKGQGTRLVATVPWVSPKSE